jgi:hypothetical protein
MNPQLQLEFMKLMTAILGATGADSEQKRLAGDVLTRLLIDLNESTIKAFSGIIQ